MKEYNLLKDSQHCCQIPLKLPLITVRKVCLILSCSSTDEEPVVDIHFFFRSLCLIRPTSLSDCVGVYRLTLESLIGTILVQYWYITTSGSSPSCFILLHLDAVFTSHVKDMKDGLHQAGVGIIRPLKPLTGRWHKQ